MAQDDHENEVEERPSERRHRSKSEKDPNRPHKTRSSRPKVIDPETGEVIKSSHRRRKEKTAEKNSERGSEPSTSMADLVPELARTASAPGATSRSSLPYPSFNKAFSKEAVNSRDDVRLPAADKTNPYTPESTDIGSNAKDRSKSAEHIAPTKSRTAQKDGRPPSPPDTDISPQRKHSTSRMSKVQEDVEAEGRSVSSNSWFGRMAGKDQIKETRSKVSVKSKSSKASTIKSPRMKDERPSAEDLRVRDSGIGSGVDSNVTSVAPKRDQETREQEVTSKRPPVLDTDSSQESAQDSSPRTPTQTPQFPPSAVPSVKPTPSPFIHFEDHSVVSSSFDSPQPPPPPPPPNVPINIPRVDYLMENGGLLRPVMKTLLTAGPAFSSQNSGSRGGTPMPSEIEKIFGPFYNVLDQYEAVINKNGSMAVATGYRSVARRLLDRLENVFNRDLSSEGCSCVMCQNLDLAIHEGSRGLGWGEVLEWVSGRRELPVWPAFDFATLGVRASEALHSGVGISPEGGPERPRSPVKMDPDIAEEFREHYLAQTKKTKHAVDRWLSSCPQTAATPPQEVDDETLSFAILTHLDQHDRPVFNALISGLTVLQPVSRAPQPKPRSEFMIKTGHSIQRLYRLPNPPRDPEAAIYLLKHPNLHNLLATMSSINASEWEILTSGRFDGFLWSGADDSTNSPALSRGPTPAGGFRGPMSPPLRQGIPSRNNTPFSPMRNQTFSPSMGGFQSRGPTPFSQVRQPVSNDEETEIAVLAEVEREIYLSMEALEDAFEGLHRKAELVRRALRERGAGLSMSLQSRQPSQPDIISAGTPGFPPSGLGPGYERQNWGEGSEMLSESDWEPESELMSELAPDDSASNISSSRHRRPKRRNERRTPALVEEEDED
ncbi:hypothetical protein ONS95_007011 [Cadophora gregata]|uniref:uncharacterized protein n=1 Tax=Cadophora gregata TaxID=51156 RepID=UPI0026DC7AD8|nr:uncharacterized protein ONS95_007011 [Cadophora gregata]KAK0100552.1 hypothetical protein ONS95_007011 [Cadophora gregata]KAK0117449.1 hypothetical protein ONS96_013280 [Cadophora gregata f. sp. sojae]